MQNIDSLKIAGKLLKSQREKKGFSIAEVCEELRLKKEIILDIENANFSNFKSYLFLKGYINNYAGFLDIKVNLPEVKNKRKKKITLKDKEVKISFKNKRNLVIYSSLIFITFISFFIINNSDSIKKKEISILKKESDINVNNVKTLENDKDIIKTKEIIIDGDKIMIEKPPDKNIDRLFLESDISELAKNNDNGISPEKIDMKLSLVITYSGDSWTEIIDSKGDIIFFDLVKKGETINFNIIAPFEILLGNATVVNIKYNNKEISIPYFNPDTNVGKIKVKN